MADLKLVVLETGDGYFLTDGDTESDSADWCVPVEFNGKRYIAELAEDAETTTLSTLAAVSEYEEIDEADIDAEDDGDGPDDGEEVAA